MFKAIRAGEHRDTWAAFSVLFGLLASHALLETGRDALFLAKIPATRLPWMYLAIAAVTLAVTQAQARVARKRRLSPPRGLAAWIAGSGAVTLAFWWLLPLLGSLGIYTLYIWSGVLTTLVMVHFWTLLGDTFSVTQAKRLYGLIGAGSVLGAIFGTGVASAVAPLFTPAGLVLASALGMGATSLLPLLFRTERSASAAAEANRISFVDSATFVARHPYASRIALLVILSTAAVTLADFLFKQTVAASVPPEDLGTYFAAVSFVLNILSLVFQVVLVGWLLRHFDLSTALVILPVLLVLGSGALVVMPSLLSALFLKGADGSLRYSVHRTAVELLYVPLSENARRRVKGFIDVVGQRGGQAGASLAILALTAMTLGPRVLAALLALIAIAWVACAIAIQAPYLDIFRRHLQETASRDEVLFPNLDVASLENLVAALDSQNNDEVVAALDLLDREGRTRLVPALILYHPSEAVVLRALGMFARTGRKNIAHVVERLLSHPSTGVRAQAAAAYARLIGNVQRLRMLLSTEEAREVRAAIMVNLIAAREIVGSDAKDAIQALLTTGSNEAKLAMIEAIASRAVPGFEEVLIALMKQGDVAVNRAAVRAAQRLRVDEAAAKQLRVDLLVPALVAALGREATRKDAMAVLPAFGELALDALERTLTDQKGDRFVRWHVPRAMVGFEPQRAATAMVRALEDDDPDGMTRYQIIRALERIVDKQPTVSLYQPTLEKAISHTVSRAFRYVDRRLTLQSGVKENPGRKTQGYEILDKILHDKVVHGVERLFRLLRLLYPEQPFDDIYSGLSSSRAADRASSMELLHSILRPPLRPAVVALVDDIPDAERLSAAGRYHQPLRLSFEGLLHGLLRSTSETLQDVTAFYIGELGLSQFREPLRALIESGAGRSDMVRAYELVGGSPAQVARLSNASQVKEAAAHAD